MVLYKVEHAYHTKAQDSLPMSLLAPKAAETERSEEVEDESPRHITRLPSNVKAKSIIVVEGNWYVCKSWCR